MAVLVAANQSLGQLAKREEEELTDTISEARSMTALAAKLNLMGEGAKTALGATLGFITTGGWATASLAPDIAGIALEYGTQRVGLATGNAYLQQAQADLSFVSDARRAISRRMRRGNIIDIDLIRSANEAWFTGSRLGLSRGGQTALAAPFIVWE